MTPGTYTAAEVARRLGVSPATFSEQRDTLQAARGFPPPLIETTFVRARRDGGRTVVRRGLWSRRQVDEWIDGRAPAEAQTIALRRLLGAGADPELAARAAAIAAGVGRRDGARKERRTGR